LIKGKQNRLAQGRRQQQQHRGKPASRVGVGAGERNQGNTTTQHSIPQQTADGSMEIPISRIIQYLTQTLELPTVVLNAMEVQ